MPSIVGRPTSSVDAGGEDAARAFYGAVLAARKSRSHRPLDTHGGCWFVGPANAAMSLHLGVEEPFVPASRRRTSRCSPMDLDGRAPCASGGVETRDDAEIGVRRFYASDPFGNRLELIDTRDAGFSARTRMNASLRGSLPPTCSRSFGSLPRR